MNKQGTALLVLLLVFILSTGVYVYSQNTLTEDEARNLFESLGCIGCHASGGVAKPFDEIVSTYKTVGQQYNGDIDAYTRENVEYFGQTFDSFDALMQQMGANVGATDQDIQALSQYFKSVFTQQGGTEQETTKETTTQPSPTQTETTTKETTTPQAEKPAIGTNTPLIVFGIAAVIIIAVLLVVFTARK